MIATRNGSAAVVRQLVDSGANTKLRNNDHAAAVDIAEARGFAAILQLLGGQ